jgi:hypothetical protein
MSRVPKVQLAQRAIEVEFAYNCHLEWLEDVKLHVLKPQKYERWRPALLLHRLRRNEEPEYVDIDRCDFDVILDRFRQLIKDGFAPFITPFPTVTDFLRLLSDEPRVQESVRSALRVSAPDLDFQASALIAPVEQTLHRAPHLVSSSDAARKKNASIPGLWLVGDAAVSLPVTKGCNLVYHVASAGKLAGVLLRGSDSATYESFVFNRWNSEVWKPDLRAAVAAPESPRAAFGSKGRFTN